MSLSTVSSIFVELKHHCLYIVDDEEESTSGTSNEDEERTVGLHNGDVDHGDIIFDPRIFRL